MRKSITAALVLLPGLLGACGGASTAGDPASVTPGGSNITDQEIVAVAEQTFPQSGQYYVVCGLDGNLTTCAYTDRLKATGQPSTTIYGTPVAC